MSASTTSVPAESIAVAAAMRPEETTGAEEPMLCRAPVIVPYPPEILALLTCLGIPLSALNPSFYKVYPAAAAAGGKRRAGEDFKQPLGWTKLALDVTKFMADGSDWLGSTDDAGVWLPVYHGLRTNPKPPQETAGLIVAEGFKPSAGGSYGPGVYCGTEMSVANGYQTPVDVPYGGSTIKFKIVVMARLNARAGPDRIVRKGTVCVAVKPEDIRPYALLVQRV